MERIKFDVVTVGAGVIGLSIAKALAKNGLKVAVIDRDEKERHASYKAGGMLGAQNEFSNDTPVFQLAQISRTHFKPLRDELLEDTGIDIQYSGTGLIKMADSGEDSGILRKQFRFLSGKGFSKKLNTIDTFGMNYKTMNIDALKDHDCLVCGQHKYEHLEKDTFRPVQSNCGRVYTLRFDDDIFHKEISGEIIKQNKFVKFITYNGYDMTLFKDGRMNVHGLDGLDEAEELYREIDEKLSVKLTD